MTISDAGWNNYFGRQEGLAEARRFTCPIDGSGPGVYCLDRWGLPTSAVHPSRAALAHWHTDPYPLDEGPGVPRLSAPDRWLAVAHAWADRTLDAAHRAADRALGEEER
jgi:hypothetical protein